MGDTSKIEWTDSSFNPWLGCTKVSPACDHCYAEAMMDSRLGKVEWGAGKPRLRTSAANWRKPLQWNARPFYECEGCGWRGDNPQGLTLGTAHHPACKDCGQIGLRPARRRVFCASLADVFDNEVDPQWRADLLHLIFKTPNLDWLLLTKRIGNAQAMLEQAVADVSLGNHSWSHQWSRGFRHVAIGATVVNQAEADRDIPKLLAVPAAVRFLSIEPMLGTVMLDHLFLRPQASAFFKDGAISNGHPLRGVRSGIDWIICGGESGPHARPMHPDWVRSLRDQCKAAGVPFLFKQWGEWLPDNQNPEITVKSGDSQAIRVGKKAAGRTLDGRTHDGFPESVNEVPQT